MHHLFTYAIIDGVCTDIFAVRIVVDVCLDPQDQDHNGVNFGFLLENESCSFVREWRQDQELDTFVNQLELLVSKAERFSNRITDSCDGDISFFSVGDYIQCTVQLDNFISLNSSLTIKEIGTPKKEFVKFVESLRQLVSERNSVYQQCGFGS